MELNVKFNDFNETIRGINNSIESIADVDRKINNCNEKLKGNWEGDSKDKYYEQYKKIANKFTDYKVCIQAMKEDLELISTKFAEMDKEITNEMNKKK